MARWKNLEKPKGEKLSRKQIKKRRKTKWRIFLKPKGMKRKKNVPLVPKKPLHTKRTDIRPTIYLPFKQPRPHVNKRSSI